MRRSYMAKKTKAEKRISVNFRVPVEMRQRLLKFKKAKLKELPEARYGPKWSLPSVMLHLLDYSLTERGF